MPYLDNNATTQPLPEVVDGVRRALEEHWHNPSSVHRPGQAARHAVELARASLAGLIGVPARQVTLTSGGTESIDLAIRGVLGASGKQVLITSRAEHAAVRNLAERLEQAGQTEVRWIPLLEGGVVDAAALPGLLEGAALVSVQWANNETGVIQPVEAIAAACRERGVPYHCDAVQWVGKMPVESPPCDLLTFSAHKFHGPKGVGGLWVRPGVRLRPVLAGSQELGRRGGTENVPGILGAGVAAEAARAWLANAGERARLAALRDRFESAVLERCPGAVVNGAGRDRLWNTTNIGFPRLEAEALLLAMSERGLAASAGSACSSGSLDPSPVLLAMGVPPEIAHGSVRFSLSRFTTDDEINEAIEIVATCVDRVGGSMVR
ncbi:MAG: cysteine desulfurase [Phycisphaeraceae bacterium]|nr:MAG: cysteine desulfurase [Phycisphaeraceae bacterium]